MRTLDADHDRERAVLGAILMYGSDALDACENEPQDFDHPGNRTIFEAMRRIDERGQRIDALEVIAELGRSDALRVAGGVEAIHALGDQFRGATNLRQHAARLRRLTEARILRDGLRELTALEDSDELIETAQARVPDLLDARDAGAVPIGEAVDETLGNIAAAQNGQKIVVPTGLGELDRSLRGGMHPGDMIVVGARPSMGKTAMLVTWIRHSIRMSYPVYVASLEMKAPQLVMRLVALMTLIDFEKLDTGMLSVAESDRVRQAAEVIRRSPLVIDDKIRTFGQFRSRVRRWRRRQGPHAWAAADYMQLFEFDNDHRRDRISNREQEVAAISRGFKLMANHLNIPVAVLCQLNRALETRGEKRPTLADLRESGAIEQDADVVMFPHREEYYHPTIENKGKAEVGIAKQRNGKLGKVDCYFKHEFMGFFSRYKEWTS